MHQVLIVDDERPVQIAIKKLGEWDRFNIDKTYYAENGREALMIMNEVRPAIVFVDINMPIMSGIELMKKAGETNMNCRFIVISGYDDFNYAQKSIRYGASDYLLKPVVKSELNSAIERVMRELYPKEVFNDTNHSSDFTAEEVVEIIKTTIENNYSDNIRLQDFADKYFFSKEYLSRLFKSVNGIGISEYLTEVRMKRACELLKQQDIKITDIAQRVGYPDKNYFSKAFHSYYNMTPSAYRKEMI